MTLAVPPVPEADLPLASRRIASRRLGAWALAGIATFAVACVVLQFLRPDLDWRRARLSFYLVGAYGAMLKLAYLALAGALGALAVGWQRALERAARSRMTAGLFCTGAVALGLTALAETSTGQPLTAAGIVHAIAAPVAFLSVTSAMLMQSWQLRRDPAWRPHAAGLQALAVLCMVALWTHALWREAPRGLTQKAVVAMILLWLGWAAFKLRHQADRGEA